MTDETETRPSVVMPDLGDLLGGKRGVIDASIPGVVLVFVDALLSLPVAIAAAVASAALLAVVRLVRREPIKQAAMGLLGLAGAAALAAFTGQAKTYFLPGILISAGYAVATLVSIAVGHPALGYVAALLDRRYAHWRTHPPLRRAAAQATAVWSAVFATRAAVQGWLYAGNHDTWLAGAKLALGLPLWAVAVTASLLLLEGQVGDEPQPVLVDDDDARDAAS
jgi:hypothetical protein